MIISFCQDLTSHSSTYFGYGATMLKKFTVSNYRQFNEPLEFDLTAGGYAFNTTCVQNDLVKLALIYGENGAGKSNLGWAIFDLVSHLTNNENNLSKDNYLNALSKDKYAKFKFEFDFLYRDK
ncbi:AAA family ATPase, partial [Ursidibacter arcticus]